MKPNHISQKAEEKDIKEILSKYLEYWYIFLLGLIIFIGAAFLYLRYEAIPQYQITSTLLIKDKDKGEGASKFESFAELGLIKPSRNIEDEIGILTSAGLMEVALSELSLQVRYYVEGKVNEVEVYGKDLPVYVEINNSLPFSHGQRLSITMLDNKRFELTEEGKDNKKTYTYGQEILKPYGTFTVLSRFDDLSSEIGNTIDMEFISIQDFAEYYSEQLEVEPVNETGSLIAVSLLDPIPERGEDIVTKLIEVYTRKAVEYKNRLAISTIEMIDDRLQHLTSELTGVEKNVEQYKQQNDLTDVNSNAAIYLQKASQAKSELADYQTQIDVLNSIENYLKQQGPNASLVPSSLNIQDATLVGLISRFNELQLEKRSLLRTTPEDNPLVVEIDEQLSDLRNNILENLNNIKDGLIITRRNLMANSNRLESQIRNVPSAERELLAINRQQSTKQELYLYLLQKREEEALSLSAPVSNTRVIDEPRSGNFPVSPNKTSIYLGAIIFGLFLPFSIVYIKDNIDDKIQSVDDIQRLTNVPVLGKIAHSNDKEIIVATEKNRTPVAELFRLIRFNLKFISAGKTNKIILITSDMKGEGKTFFTINLGTSLAISGKKVIALSFDLRAPKLMQDMGLSNKVGVTDYIINHDTKLEEIIVPSPSVENLFFIDSGSTPPNAGELMLSERIGKLLNELKERYDYVLIDSAPVGKVADAFALAPHIDSTIFVVRRNYSNKARLVTIQDIYENKKLKYPMVVLNDVEFSKADTYGYGNE
ncbi:polysaccharide biosynthesis tyrosine autokinase [Salegentibacter sp. F188]|uniref:non-specific protein-tyrosine kinase n=1 Tax=Autumnicola patrickiae TaxID=3075591 RepID=A0ABU3DYP1_9FLAO|nr:polysaccharide biosynthesis tyrosine autokinase [Salegentibacter sp. F188]MDT0688838.1 polysaccharide biosynthesis tyrosine autokinase [Salegentibacter sp. F188]